MASTIYEVARQAGVSTATVSRMLNGAGPVAPATRQRIQAAIQELGYHPNHVARSLVTATTRTIAILLPDITNPFFPALVKGVQLLADERRYTLLLLNTGADPAKEEASLQVLRGRQIDGVIMVGVVARGELIAAALGKQVPIVVLDRAVDGLVTTLVTLDNVAGARAATEHLLGLGHRAVAHITGPRALQLVRQRVRAYRATLRAAAIDPDPRLMVPGDFTEGGGYRAMERLLERRVGFTSVFAANDLTAIGAVAALGAHGLGVPDDVSVVGFDDIDLSAYTAPPLTTIRQPTYEMGRRAATSLIDSIEERVVPSPGVVLFQPKLVVRKSTARVSSRRDSIR